ncbi:MAG: rod shape-determining protein MreC [bacterium]|nr:rod shape-determining protein MreC [bacterium]
MAGISSILLGKGLKPWIFLSVAVSLSLLLMAVGGNQTTESARSRTAEILAILANPFGSLSGYLHLRGENERLRAANSQLMLKASRADEAFKENERLRRLLDFEEQSDLRLIAAGVIARDPLPGVRSLLINVGRILGVEKHMAVINDRGLVGKVVRVGPRTSVVQLLMDRNLGAAVRLENSRADGITTWEGSTFLLIEGIPVSANVKLGEQVLTSGLDGIFPEGIPVGEVLRIDRLPQSLFLRIELKPAVDFAGLEEILIVRQKNTPIVIP